MRGHLDDCMSFASCSSAGNTEDEDEDVDQLVRRRADENQGSLEDVSESEHDFGAWSHDQMGTHNEHGDDNHSSGEQSPDLGEVERERVRQIMRGWMETGINEHSSDATRRANNTPRKEWLGESERERVRLVREWVHMSSQQRARGGRRDDQLAGSGAPADRAHGGRVNRQEGQPEHIRRDKVAWKASFDRSTYEDRT